MVVHMGPASAQGLQVFAAVIRYLNHHTHHIEAVLVFWVDHQVGIVLALLVEAVLLLPSHAPVTRAKYTPLTFGRFHDGIKGVGVGRGDCQTDAAHVACWQASANFVPCFAPVGAPVNGTFGTAIHQGEDMPAALVGGRHQNFRMIRILNDVGDAGVVADSEDFVPCFAAVDGLVEAPVATRTPQWALRGDIDGV